MRKGVQLVILSAVIALLCLVVAPHAHASTRQATTVQKKLAVASQGGGQDFHPNDGQEENQFYRGNAFSHTRIHLRGHTQNDLGNQGVNRGVNKNYAANGGNLIVHSRKNRQHQRINQVFEGNSYSFSRINVAGYNQDNSGNQGLNEGLNVGHGANGGNQIVN